MKLIPREHDHFTAYVMGRVAEAAYSPARVARGLCYDLGLLYFNRFKFDDSEGIVARNDHATVIGFTGTAPSQLRDLLADANACLIPGPFRGGDRVHAGFSNYLDRVWNDVRDAAAAAAQDRRDLYLTGHSLGGALAQLAAARIAHELKIEVAGVYTFGGPRVGNREWRALFNYVIRPAWRYRNNNDLITRLPCPSRYRHVGRDVLHFGAGGELWHNPSFPRVLLDRWSGRRRGWLAWGTDGIRDHFMATYSHLLARHSGGVV